MTWQKWVWWVLLFKKTLLSCHVPDTHTIWYHSWCDPIIRCSLQFHRGIFPSYEMASVWRMPLLNRYGLEHTSLMRQSPLFPRLKSPNSALLPEVHTHTTRRTRLWYLKIQLDFQPGLNISIIVWAASKHINTCIKFLQLFFFLLHHKSTRRNWDLTAVTDSAELKKWHDMKSKLDLLPGLVLWLESFSNVPMFDSLSLLTPESQVHQCTAEGCVVLWRWCRWWWLTPLCCTKGQDKNGSSASGFVLFMYVKVCVLKKRQKREETEV